MKERNSIIIDILVTLGLEFYRDKITDEVQEKKVQNRLNDFIERELKHNSVCTLEEEIDFQEVADYLTGPLIEDVKLRLRGSISERAIAHRSIVNKVKHYAKAHTKVGENRAVKMAEKAIEIIKRFHKKRANAELSFLISEAAEDIDIRSAERDRKTHEELAKLREDVKALGHFSPEQLVAEGLRKINSGETKELEKDITDCVNVLSTKHELYPHYGFRIVQHNGEQQMRSYPLSPDAIKLYPPKIKFTGTVEIGDKVINEVTSSILDYSYRHQIPLKMNVKTAKKTLGTKDDPIQYEAEELTGKTIILSPPQFAKAIPCSLGFNGITEFDYILLRVQEILDDGTRVVSNLEQTDCPFLITFNFNMSARKCTEKIKLRSTLNSDKLKYLKVMKNIEGESTFSIKSLEHQQELVYGALDKFEYSTGFDSIDEEIEFWEMLLAIEEYFKATITVPKEILEDDFEKVYYLYNLITEEKVTGSWESYAFEIQVTENLKKDVASWGENPISLSYVGSVTVALWGEEYCVSIVRRFVSMKAKDLEYTKKKVDVLDIGETMRLEFISGEEVGIYEDVLYKNTEQLSEEVVPLVP